MRARHKNLYSHISRPRKGKLKYLGVSREINGKRESKEFFDVLPNKLKNFRLFSLAQLHALLHGGDDAVGLVFGAVLRALLRRPWNKHARTWTKKVLWGDRRRSLPVKSRAPATINMLPHRIRGRTCAHTTPLSGGVSEKTHKSELHFHSHSSLKGGGFNQIDRKTWQLPQNSISENAHHLFSSLQNDDHTPKFQKYILIKKILWTKFCWLHRIGYRFASYLKSGIGEISDFL